jgi:undecaprenyl-diphosphatase
MSLNEPDQALFRLLHPLGHPGGDVFWHTVSQRYVFVGVSVLLAGYLARHYRWAALGWVLVAALLIGASDFVASGILKPWIARLRPCHEPELEAWVKVVGKCGGQFGFVSSHAANSVALAVFAWRVAPHRVVGWAVVGFALLHSYSRIYMGVHYPGDILGGALVGIVLAILFTTFAPRIVPALRRPTSRLTHPETEP